MRKNKTVLSQRQLFRVIDANYNRAKEGLRVCEDICRFVLDDKALTAGFKKVRHALVGAIAVFGLKEIVSARDILKDVGKKTVDEESKRFSVEDLLYSNSQRVKESLRVLEEFAKLVNIKAAERLKRLRYTLYDLEKETFKRL
ncbi:MAG: thiamine-phosphate pyrophosphorylase [Candidatus Omnitrophica bacterium]|nr:thiamine-phosphate pyrophosphorylase [Candidatus Omnitrophota bacterium]